MAKRTRGFSFIDIVVRPRLTFLYNYFLRLGFLDGREGLLLHLYHARLCELEVCEGVGNEPQEVTPSSGRLRMKPACR